MTNNTTDTNNTDCKPLTQEEFWDISAHICNTSVLNRDEKSVASWTLGEVWKELKERGHVQSTEGVS